jgi:hypothetical protein
LEGIDHCPTVGKIHLGHKVDAARALEYRDNIIQATPTAGKQGDKGYSEQTYRDDYGVLFHQQIPNAVTRLGIPLPIE